MAAGIVVLGTGGTIAGTSDVAGANVGYTAAQLGVQQLLAAVPQLAQAARPAEIRPLKKGPGRYPGPFRHSDCPGPVPRPP